MAKPEAVPAHGQGAAVECPFSTVTSAFYHCTRTCPSTVAVRDLSQATREVTYYELAQQAQALARQLNAAGVTPGQRVPLVVKRGLEMVVGIWAILSCGAQYVPLDGGVVPDSTIRHVLEQSGGRLALCLRSTVYRVQDLCPETQAVVIEDVLAAASQDNPVTCIDLATADQGCYVIYTSGTTGKPKGVDVSHRNVSNLVCQAPGNLYIQPGTCVGSVLNISFDMAAWEIFACLCNGGTLVIRGAKWEPALSQIDTLICTPTILSKYSPTDLPRIKMVATAGEPSSQGLADLWAAHGTYYNCCGPTETTIVNTMSRHAAGEPLSIGRPTPNNSVYILDGQHRPVAPGQAGVMWAGGLGVSRGYVGLQSKTREVYIPDPFAQDGSMMYKTGDLGAWRADGQIDILGRLDDQVKVKGFRVELDGIASSLASAPGVTRAVALLIDEQLHGFISPSHIDSKKALDHCRTCQPYYAVPSKVHCLDAFPTTANGKIDKKALQVLALQPPVTTTPAKPILAEMRSPSLKTLSDDAATLVEEGLVPVFSKTSTLTELTESDTVSLEKADLNQDVPHKRWQQPFRGLRHRVLIVYRVLLSLMFVLNMSALVALLATKASADWLVTLTAINLLIGVLIRQDMVINILYTIFCSVPKSAPLQIRKRCAKIYHLGGVHSGAGVCATAWILVSTIRATLVRAGVDPGVMNGPTDSVPVLVLSWIISLLCCALLGFAWPSVRKRFHNLFERFHRFVGWTVLVLFWIRTGVSVSDSTPVRADVGMALVKNPGFWMLGVATCSVASSWLFLRKVPVHSQVLSDHAVQLTFDYTVPVNGSFTRLSRKPLTEWHSFATIPHPRSAPGPGGNPGYSLVVSNAGDWTKSCIRNPPTELWVRGLPTCGVMRIATLFNRVVVIATGSGIGPLLGHIGQPSCPTQLIWSTANPEKTFGKDMIDTIRRTIPQAVIHDTKLLGRPDLVKMGYNMAKASDAEAVIIIANEKITKKVVYGLETRGVAAYGAIWDS